MIRNFLDPSWPGEGPGLDAASLDSKVFPDTSGLRQLDGLLKG